MTEYIFWTESVNTYPGFVCSVCLKTMTETNLERCSGCKLIFYCCKEHQRFHWPLHKKLCMIIQNLLKNPHHSALLTKAFTSDEKERERFLSDVTFLCESFMKRRMTKEEYHLLQDPFVCKVCHISKDKKIMITCKDCCAITYCCQEHKFKDALRHSLSCKKLKKKLEYFKHFRGKIIIFAKVRDFIRLPTDMEAFLGKAIITKTIPLVEENHALLYLSEIFTIPLTVIYAIEKGLSGSIIKKSNYTIHVVGCRQFENCAVATWQYIFHHFKMLDSIDLIYIGPEVSSDYLSPPVLTSTQCISRKKINFKMEPVKYHEYLTKNNSEKPDIIIAFHCGFYDYKCLMKNETWKYSMPSLNFPGAVVAFTSYRESEAKEDLKIFKESFATGKPKFLVEGELNPFRNLLCDGVNENDEMTYRNGYITVAKCL